MNILLIILIIAAIAVLGTGFLVEALQFLIWVGLVLAAIAVVMWLLRVITGRKTV